jgi:uncharacterized protein (DUF2384 family)
VSAQFERNDVRDESVVRPEKDSRERSLSKAEEQSVPARNSQKADRGPTKSVLEKLALSAFGKKEYASEWFNKPAFGLGFKKPGELLNTPEGRKQVETLLWQIRYNVYI